MKIIEKLLLFTSWLMFISTGILVVWVFIDLVSSRAAFCSNFPSDLVFLCTSVYHLISQFVELILNKKFEILGFVFERSRDVILLLVISGIGTAIFIRVIARLLRIRRQRLRGFFVDLPGFSPIESDHHEEF